MIQTLLVFLILIAIAIFSSIRIIKEPYNALVVRLGQYNRTLKSGVNFIIPVVEYIAIEALMSERVVDIPPQQAITKDSVSLTIDAVVYWRILNLQKAYYSIDNVERAIGNLALTTLRSKIGQMNLDQTYASRKEINQDLLRQLDESTESWGVKVTRVEVRDITPAKTVIESMELERAAEIKRRAAIKEAQGEAQSLELMAKALQMEPSSQEFLKFLIAQKYVDANYRLSDSENAKVVFMDPKAMSEAMTHLLGSSLEVPNQSSRTHHQNPPDANQGGNSEGTGESGNPRSSNPQQRRPGGNRPPSSSDSG